ncbi:hypothetical protein E2542_SST21743 [Spatholobus suberectus]|nr:hypothetical protein E2542_SST21743 [Spatholobus suberectus]
MALCRFRGSSCGFDDVHHEIFGEWFDEVKGKEGLVAHVKSEEGRNNRNGDDLRRLGRFDYLPEAVPIFSSYKQHCLTKGNMLRKKQGRSKRCRPFRKPGLIALFDVDGTLTAPRKVSVSSRANDTP